LKRRQFDLRGNLTHKMALCNLSKMALLMEPIYSYFCFEIGKCTKNLFL
jgi:hypothetical protein